MELVGYLHLFIISLVLILITKRYLHIHFSKPLALPILGHLHLLHSPIHQSLTKLTQKHGHVLHLLFGSHPVLVISSPSATKECFTNNDIIFANRPLMLAGKHLGYNHTAVVFSPYNQRWREHRRFMALHALSPARLPSFSSDVHSLILKLYSGAGEGCNYFKKVEVRDVLFELMLNVIPGLIAGKKYSGEGCGDPEEGRKFRELVEEAFLLSGASTVADFIPAVRWMGIGGAEKRMERVGKEMDEFYQKIIEEKRRVGKWKEYDDGDQEKKSNIIDVMLAMQQKEKDHYSDVAIKGVMTSLLAAGTETTAGTMEWAMALLLNHPNALKKAKAEIREQVGHSHLIKDSDIPKLHYLNNVIKETLRLFPAGAIIPAHESSQDCTVSVSHIPKGTMLLVNAYAMQRDVQFWDNPLEFKPERFDSSYDDHVHGDEGYKYIPFGTGRRRCPGESLACKVMGLTLGALIQCFEWERVGKELVDLSEGVGHSMPMAKPLQAMYKPCLDMHVVLSQL